MKKERMIYSSRDLINQLGVKNFDSLKKAIYKGTSCGAWVNETKKKDGIIVGSIVEGVDDGTETYCLTYPFEYNIFWATLDKVEKEANYIWNMTHGCENCPENIDLEGYHIIDPHCKFCNGEGVII